MTTVNIQTIWGQTEVARQLQRQFIGAVYAFPSGTTLGSEWVERAGIELSRTTQANLWEWVQNTQETILTDEDWLAAEALSPNGSVAYYSSGDGETTFRVPSVGTGGFDRAIGSSEVDAEYLQNGFADSTAVNGLAVTASSSFTGTAVTPTATLSDASAASHYHYGITDTIVDEGTNETDITSSTYLAAGSIHSSYSQNYVLKSSSTTANIGRTSSSSPAVTGTVKVNAITPVGSVSTSTELTGDSETRPVGQYVKHFIYTGADSASAGTISGDVAADLQAQIDVINENIGSGSGGVSDPVTITANTTVVSNTSYLVDLTEGVDIDLTIDTSTMEEFDWFTVTVTGATSSATLVNLVAAAGEWADVDSEVTTQYIEGVTNASYTIQFIAGQLKIVDGIGEGSTGGVSSLEARVEELESEVASLESELSDVEDMKYLYDLAYASVPTIISLPESACSVSFNGEDLLISAVSTGSGSRICYTPFSINVCLDSFFILLDNSNAITVPSDATLKVTIDLSQDSTMSALLAELNVYGTTAIFNVELCLENTDDIPRSIEGVLHPSGELIFTLGQTADLNGGTSEFYRLKLDGLINAYATKAVSKTDSALHPAKEEIIYGNQEDTE